MAPVNKFRPEGWPEDKPNTPTPDKGLDGGTAKDAALGKARDKFSQEADKIGIPKADQDRIFDRMIRLSEALNDAARKYLTVLSGDTSEAAFTAWRQSIHALTELPHEELENLLSSLIHLYATTVGGK